MKNNILKSNSFGRKGLLVFTMLLFFTVISCEQKDEVTPVSKEKLLAGEVSISWRLTSSSRDTIKTLSPSCKTNSIKNADNKFVFSKGNAFEYDNGTITQDETCQVNCCSDLADLIGNWLIRNDSLRVTVNARIDNGVKTPIQEGIILYGKINKLDENELTLSNGGIVVTYARIP
jgi:hypothetical protein